MLAGYRAGAVKGAAVEVGHRNHIGSFEGVNATSALVTSGSECIRVRERGYDGVAGELRIGAREADPGRFADRAMRAVAADEPPAREYVVACADEDLVASFFQALDGVAAADGRAEGFGILSADEIMDRIFMLTNTKVGSDY